MLLQESSLVIRYCNNANNLFLVTSGACMELLAHAVIHSWQK